MHMSRPDHQLFADGRFSTVENTDHMHLDHYRNPRMEGNPLADCAQNSKGCVARHHGRPSYPAGNMEQHGRLRTRRDQGSDSQGGGAQMLGHGHLLKIRVID